MMLLNFTLVFIGLLFLSLSMKRHYSQIKQHKKNLSKQVAIVFQILACLCLIAALILSVQNKGFSIGLVFFLGLITLVTLLQVFMLAYRPQWFLGAGIMMGMVSLFHGVIK